MANDKTHSITLFASAIVEARRFVDKTGAHASTAATAAGISEQKQFAGKPFSAVTGYAYEVDAAEAISEGAFVKPSADGSGRAVLGSVSDNCGYALTGSLAGQKILCRFIERAGGGASAAITISGSLTVGQTLTATPGTGWEITTGQWYVGGQAVNGATGMSYQIQPEDVTKPIAFRGTGLPFRADAGVVAAPPFSTTWRAVATNTVFPNNFSAAYQQMSTRRRHFVRSRLTGLKVRLVNTYVDPATWTEKGPGASTTFVINVERNGVNLGKFKLAGNSSMTVVDMGQADSDVLAVDLYPGDVIYTREFRTNANGIIYEGNATSGTRPGYNDTANGEACYAAASGLVDQTDGVGALVGGANVPSAMGGPFALIGLSSDPALGILGDSEEVGIGETMSAAGNRGGFARSLALRFACVKVAQGGDGANRFIQSNAKRRAALAGIVTYVECNYGVNDINNNAQTPAATAANLTTIAGYFPGIPFDWRTMTPYANSSDSFATTAGQTPGSTAASLNTLNNLMRAGRPGIRRVWETSDVLSNGRDSNIWKADGNVANRRTADGLHLTGIAGDDLVASGVYDPAAFTPY